MLHVEHREFGAGTADQVIVIWTGGGMSHIDTLAPKPEAPATMTSSAAAPTSARLSFPPGTK